MTFSSKNGFWAWDNVNNGVIYLTKEFLQRNPSKISKVSSGIEAKPCRNKIQNSQIRFQNSFDYKILILDNVDVYGELKFKKHYQRKVKIIDVAVITLQDVKDVAIYTCKIDYLFPEFITFFHTSSIDRFLRSMIVYFQYYFQVWNKMQLRRKEASRKLRQPIVTELENEVRDNLADLRSMVARDYAAVLMGIGDSKKFHHMNNKNNDSLSNRDRRIYETLIFMTVKVIWIALFRENLTWIDQELQRLLRTLNYSLVENTRRSTIEATQDERRVLLGKAFRTERKLLHRSPAIQEIIFDQHDHRLLSIGINDIPDADERIRYLEIAYAAPEEMLVNVGIAVGVLGVQRKYLDAMLKPLEIFPADKQTSLMKIGEFKIPSKSPLRRWLSTDILSSHPSHFQESETAKQDRIIQCKKWRCYLETRGVLLNELTQYDSTFTL
ncbi:hypothetical protein ABEB36_003764 [Hypothenemus hampei]|uniref:Uncharacterized protein n=1 Tax=Hypothenemus hampei TaxID=57062 RepID=A0ABD1F118_HYPHA